MSSASTTAAGRTRKALALLTSGGWTCPAGVFEVEATLVSGGCGGGGGGGGVMASDSNGTQFTAYGGSGGAGGASGYARTVRIPVVPGTVYPVVIGAGGTPGAGGAGGALQSSTAQAPGTAGGLGFGGGPTSFGTARVPGHSNSGNGGAQTNGGGANGAQGGPSNAAAQLYRVDPTFSVSYSVNTLSGSSSGGSGGQGTGNGYNASNLYPNSGGGASLRPGPFLTRTPGAALQNTSGAYDPMDGIIIGLEWDAYTRCGGSGAGGQSGIGAVNNNTAQYFGRFPSGVGGAAGLMGAGAPANWPLDTGPLAVGVPGGAGATATVPGAGGGGGGGGGAVRSAPLFNAAYTFSFAAQPGGAGGAGAPGAVYLTWSE